MSDASTQSKPVFFQEEEYQITIPPTEEPNVRVGIVLKEDQISIEKITFPDHGELIDSARKTYEISANTSIEIKAVSSGLDVFSLSPEKKLLAHSPNKITLRTIKPIVFEPSSGFLVERVVAGRIFHWRKEIPQYFSGSLEIHNNGGALEIINELPFEEYLCGVATAEMSSECPLDTLKAQVLAARSYTLAYMHGKHPGEAYTVCNDDDCQRYQGTTHVYPHINKAIQETRGEVIAFNGNVVRAHYSKCCAGFVESPEDVWEISVPGLGHDFFDGKNCAVDKINLSDEKQYQAFLDLPQSELKNIYCAVENLPAKELKKYLGTVDEQAEYMRWNYELSAERLSKNLKERFNLSDLSEVIKIEAAPSNKSGKIRTCSGRLVAINIFYKDKLAQNKIFHIPREYNIRRALHESFLFSSAFVHEHVYENNRLSKIKFRGSGWGHGAGYCQIGGLGMGLKGINYKQIIQHYFPECEVIKSY